MKIRGFLTVTKGGSMKVTKSYPKLNYDEIAISFSLEIPSSVFDRPAIHAEIKITEDQVAPREITAETVNNVRDALLQHAGIELIIMQPGSTNTNGGDDGHGTK